MASILPQGKTQFFNALGAPLSGGLVYTYVPGTTKPATTWQDQAQTIANPNPITLDSGGFCLLWGSGAYRLQIFDGTGILVNDTVSYAPMAQPDAVSKIPTIAALRLLDSSFSGVAANVAAYATVGDQGGGIFVVNANDTATADNGGTIIVDAAGRRWYRQYSGAVSAEWFGAAGDGVTDDTAALQAALGLFGSSGGTVYASKRYLINSANLIIPQCVRLEGNFSDWKGQQYSGATDYRQTQSSCLILNTAYSITLQASGAIKGFQIVRKGISFPETDTSLFAGTAISCVNANFANDTNGTYIGSCQILGFAQAIKYEYNSRVDIENISGDNLSGISINQSGDVCTINNLHFWPYVTNSATATAAQNFRSGSGLELANLNDISKVSNAFVYSYQICYDLSGGSISALTMVNCSADGTAQPNCVGFKIGSQKFTALADCVVYNQETALLLNDTDNNSLFLTNFRGYGPGGNSTGISITQGTAVVVSGELTGWAYGLSVAGASSNAVLATVSFSGNATNDILAASGATIYGAETCQLASNASGGWNFPSVASADPLPLPAIGDTVIVSGTTGFGGIAGGRAGRCVTLFFEGALTVFNGTGSASNARLSGAANFTTAAGSTLTLKHDGTQWYEIGRCA